MPTSRSRQYRYTFTDDERELIRVALAELAVTGHNHAADVLSRQFQDPYAR